MIWPLTGLASLGARALGYGLAAAALAFGVHALDKSRQQIGYDRAAAAYTAAADAQATRNRATARAAVVRYIERERVRTETIERIKTEVIHEAADLATCRLPGPVVRLLNDAAARALEDRPTPGGAHDRLPDPAAPAE